MSNLSISSLIISMLSYILNLSDIISTIFGSNSTAITFLAFCNNIAVKVPNPGPISIIVSSLSTPFAIVSNACSSNKKFCPNFLFA